ncbi:SDR family NAD(P)-dependent oxidoreductase [uncultured Phenylobacterium sp.]|uniref:SDR family NAD(P)-dependent oxidoreductase n=1 Tax=uncultured Phenylobacterium sp. TaxID=349273 RepID=UPI0025CF5B99|nr:SDR family NAD(P)-dependent oxidoreductase [uncultured Phenylobacterium sp.]
MAKLAGKVAVITGAARGIGRSTAEVMAREGAAVVLADRDLDVAEAAAQEIGSAAAAVRFDATDADSIEAVIAFALKQFGKIDVLHNNVAMTAEAWSRDTSVLDTTLETWDLTMTINLRSMFVASKAALPYLIAGGGGSIINMASGAATSGSPGLVAYGTSKGGVMTFTKYLAVQYGRDNVRSNCILPGVIQTEQLLNVLGDNVAAATATTPYPRAGLPTDVAELVAFLASDAAQFLNGQMIHCDGGSSAGRAGPRRNSPA